MKNLIYTLSMLSGIWLIISSCGKGGGNYSTADHTGGVVNVVRSWSGSANGYIKGDTVIPPATTSVDWAKGYSRTITDTSFAVQKINGFEIAVIGYPLNYLLTNPVGNIVKFDSTMSGSAVSFLYYFGPNDSMSFQYHQITGQNSISGQYYQTNYYLHTNHS